MVKGVGNMHLEDEEMKNIPICELFYRVVLDIAGPLPKTTSRNKYILVIIDHYSKWCVVKVVGDYGSKTTTKFLEDDVICR